MRRDEGTNLRRTKVLESEALMGNLCVLTWECAVVGEIETTGAGRSRRVRIEFVGKAGGRCLQKVSFGLGGVHGDEGKGKDGERWGVLEELWRRQDELGGRDGANRGGQRRRRGNAF